MPAQARSGSALTKVGFERAHLGAARQSPVRARVSIRMSLLDAEVLPEFDGSGSGDRRAWFGLRLRAVPCRLRCDILGTRGVSVTTVPQYAVLRALGDGRSAASATLSPPLESEELVVPFELAWDVDLGEREQQVALVAVWPDAPGATPTERLELPVQLRVGAARGAMSRIVTRAVCDAMAGKALYLAALGEDSAERSARLLADAAAWIRGRGSAAGLDPGVDLGPMLRTLALAQALFEAGPTRR